MLLKNICKFLFVALIIITSISCSEKKTISSDKLQLRGYLVYEINSEYPFSGKVIASFDNSQKNKRQITTME